MQPILRCAAMALLLVGLAACQTSDETDATPTPPEPAPSATPEASTAASPSATASDTGEETSVYDLAQGDCFSAEGQEEQAVETVIVVDCEATHLYEVFAVFDHEAGEDDPYPGDDEMLEYADAACQPHFEDYVGIDYEESIYWITSVTPSQETWDDGDREIVCALKLGEEGEETTGSAEGSGD